MLNGIPFEQLLDASIGVVHMLETIALVVSILALFVTSAVAYLAIRLVRRLAFERRHLPFLPYDPGDYLPGEHIGHHPGVFRMLDFIRDFEREHDIRLTPAARQMVLLPIMEYFGNSTVRRFFRKERRLHPREEDLMLRDSVAKILVELEESPSQADRSADRRQRSTTSVVRAFWRRFCRIPPFCAGEDEQ